MLEFFMRVSDLPTRCIASLDFAGLEAIGIENWIFLLRAEASFAVGDVSNGKQLLASAKDGAGKTYVTAKLHFSQGEYQKALEILLPLKKVETIAAFAHLMSGQIYEAMGLKSAALKEYYLSTQKEKEGRFRDWRNIIRPTPSSPKRSLWRLRVPSPGRSKKTSPSFCTCLIMLCTVLFRATHDLSKIMKTRKSQGPPSHLPL